MRCPNGHETGWMPGWRPCTCRTARHGGHDRFDCKACNYTAVPDCVDENKEARVFDYRRPNGGSM